MDVFLSILAGVVCGLMGSLPYLVVLRLLKKQRSTKMRPALIAVGVSLLLMMLGVALGWFVFRETLLVFIAALIIAFMVGVAISLFVFGHKRG